MPVRGVALTEDERLLRAVRRRLRWMAARIDADDARPHPRLPDLRAVQLRLDREEIRRVLRDLAGRL